MRKIMDGIWNVDVDIDLNFYDGFAGGNGGKSGYYFLDYTNSPRELKASIYYDTMDEAVRAYLHNRIEWES